MTKLFSRIKLRKLKTRPRAMKQRLVCLAAMLLALLALAFSSCAEQEGSGLDGPPDSSEVHPNLGPGAAGISTTW
jgi:hypothetical protein